MKRNIFRSILLISALYIATLQTYAVPADRRVQTITQADGTSLNVVLKGDEFHHYYETEDGYLVVKNEKGIFNYAKVNASGTTIDTQVKAHDLKKRDTKEKSFVKDLETQVSMVTANTQNRVKRVNARTNSPAKRAYPLSGNPNSLVILVNFSDLAFKTPDPKTAFSNLLNKEGYNENGATGSARDYFVDNSMGKFNPEFDVVGPFTLPKEMSYYGSNDNDGMDINPVQMVVDACVAAHNAGVNFADYDTDNDKIADNVFIYYAGHNEAEHAADITVWPHRWGVYPKSMYGDGNYTGTVSSVTFDGVRIEDYACTSEFKGKAGTNMCGIGTFTHEFGHVLGLADMYATNGATHYTLGDWSIMDGGVYLNSGRTPPAYNAFERFQLGFLTPKILTNPASIELSPLVTGNEAYIITQNDSHNLNPESPAPSEFFILENRQKIGWDSYLPGNGMLIYRINYNKSNFYNNSVNNNINDMGVDIMEADGIGSESTMFGDPFPGFYNKKEYIPVLRSGVTLDKPITKISVTDKIVSFRYKGGGNIPTVRVVSSPGTFRTEQGTPSEAQSFSVSGSKLISNISITFSKPDHYEMKRADDTGDQWYKSITLSAVDSIVAVTDILVRYNPLEPSYQLSHTTDFTLAANGADEVKLSLYGKSTRKVYVVAPTATEATEVDYKGFVANWSNVNDATGYYLSVYTKDDNGITSAIISDRWVSTNSERLYHLISGREYSYRVKASDKNEEYQYENITSFSNMMKVTTAEYTETKVLRVVANNGTLKIFTPQRGDIINVFNMYGQKIRSINADSDIIEIDDLHPQMVYIITSGKYRAKVIL